MKTETEQYPLDLAPTSLQSHCLEIIRASEGIDESDLLCRIWPKPIFPAVGQRTPDAIEAWRKAEYDWSSRAYYRAGVVEYKDCYSSLISCAAIALRKAGYIRTTNNGFNCYTYWPTKARP